MKSDEPSPGEPITLEQLFGVVRSGTRRRILDAMLAESPRGIEELAALERGHRRDADAARVTLYHDHLPRLDEAGVIRWNRERETVARGPQFGEIRPFIELMQRHRDAFPAGWP